MSQIKKKFILNDAIDGSKILFNNNEALRSFNSEGYSTELLKYNESDKLEFLVLPQVAEDPSAGDDVTRKSWVDSEVAAVQGEVDALEGRMDTAEGDIQALEDKLGVANGIATLDGSGLVPSSQLPSYVDDVLEFADLASFPATGESGKIYVALDTNKTYRWSGSTYIYITSGAVDSVNGQTGVVVLESDDIALEEVVREATHVQGALEALDAALATAEGDIDSLETRMGQAESDIDAVEGRMTTAEGDIDAVEGRVTTAEGDIDALEGRMGTAEDDIFALENRASALEGYSVVFQPMVGQEVTAGILANKYLDLPYLALEGSLRVFVDRLALHEGPDYMVSVIDGVTTRLDLTGIVDSAEEALAEGDILRIYGASKAI